MKIKSLTRFNVITRLLLDRLLGAFLSLQGFWFEQFLPASWFLHASQCDFFNTWQLFQVRESLLRRQTKFSMLLFLRLCLLYFAFLLPWTAWTLQINHLKIRYLKWRLRVIKHADCCLLLHLLFLKLSLLKLLLLSLLARGLLLLIRLRVLVFATYLANRLAFVLLVVFFIKIEA